MSTVICGGGSEPTSTSSSSIDNRSFFCSCNKIHQLTILNLQTIQYICKIYHVMETKCSRYSTVKQQIALNIIKLSNTFREISQGLCFPSNSTGSTISSQTASRSLYDATFTQSSHETFSWTINTPHCNMIIKSSSYNTSI